MSKVRKLVVERWLEGIVAQLGACGYTSIEEVVHDSFDKVGPYYRAVGLGENALNGFIVEATVAIKWVQYGMQAYDFDPDFTNSIVGETWAEMLPDVLGYVPHTSFYLKLPHNDTSEGTVVAVVKESEVDFGSMDDLEFQEYVSTRSGKITLVRHPEMGEDKWAFAYVETQGENYWILRYAIPSTIGYMYDETPLGEYPINLLLNALAYICTANADINTFYMPPKGLKPNPKKDKKRSLVTMHRVGYTIGSQLREYARYASESKEHQGGTVRPHMRRAHWHHYWVGPKDNRRLELRWLPPVKVGFGELEAVTLHRVS